MQQAVLEATSKRQKFIDRGYTEEEEESEVPLLPMLAHPFEKRGKSIDFPCIAQHKLDGVRVMARLATHKALGVELRSRTGKELHNFNQLRRDIAHILEQNPTLVLDGELYSDDISFDAISGLCRLKPLRDEPEDMQLIRMCTFDCVNPEQPDLGFEERYALLSASGRVNVVSKLDG